MLNSKLEIETADKSDALPITTLNLPPRADCTKIVPHTTWRQTRSALLEAISSPTTLALLGDAGTGKTWLLRHLEAILQRHGHPVTFLRQGDLPWQLSPGTILLIDEASRLDPEALAILAAQRSMIVILADLPKFGEVLAQQSPPPRIIRLPPLGPDQVADFVAKWLLMSDRDVAAVTADGVERLALHSGGTPRLITRLLNAAFVVAAETAPITGAAIDEVATLRWNGSPAAPAEARPNPAPPDPAPPDPAPRDPAPRDPALRPALSPKIPIATRKPRRSRARMAAAAAVFAALAATAVLAIRATDATRQVQQAAPPIAKGSGARQWTRGLEPASVPTPEPASTNPVTVITAITPERAAAVAPSLVGRLAPPSPLTPLVAMAQSTTPSLMKAPIPQASPAAFADRAAASALAAPPETPVAEPALSPLPEAKTALRPSEAEVPVAMLVPEREPGLILIARRGDTLSDLYATLYRGVAAPPFEEVIAANPRPVLPGTIVVFPAPVGGWLRR